MQIYVTRQGGRVVQGDTPHGKFRVEWTADGALISATLEAGSAAPPIERTRVTPPGTWLAAVIKAAVRVLTLGIVSIQPCSSCNSRMKAMNTAGWRGLPKLAWWWLQRQAIKTQRPME